MNCPICRADETRVVDSRLASDGTAIRRRRQCVQCDYRFTTFERVEETPLIVNKSDGSTEPFDRAKLVGGIAAAIKGRNVSDERIGVLATAIEDEMRLLACPLTSSQIGLAVLDGLRDVDEVAYLRFASVYKNFDAASDFQNELEFLGKLNPVAPSD